MLDRVWVEVKELPELCEGVPQEQDLLWVQGAGDDGVGEGGEGALWQSLGEEASGGVAKGSEGGKGEEPELRGWFIYLDGAES